MSSPFGKARVFRDPVHDIISFKEDPTLGPIVCALIDTREMQRLRFVRQLGLAHLVFHGAEHSRFAHSLGVAHVARRMTDRLDLDEDQRLAVICSALLHDLGHAPFSHVMERVFEFRHEERSEAIVLDGDTEVHGVLRAVDPTFPARVAELIGGRTDSWVGDIIASQLDADRADYLLRDGLMTGVKVGQYDLERILLMLDHDDEGLLVEIGGYEAVEGYLIARYHMYRLVYFHRVVRSAEAMLECAFSRARTRIEEGDMGLAPPGTLGSLMRRETVAPSDYADVGDYDAWSLIAAWRDDSDNVLADLCDDLMRRRLFACREREVDDWDDELTLVARVREELAANERWYFFADEAGDVPYRPYVPRASNQSVRIRGRDGRVFHIEQRSHVARALADAAYRLRRWYYHPMLEAKLRRIVGNRW